MVVSHLQHLRSCVQIGTRVAHIGHQQLPAADNRQGGGGAAALRPPPLRIGVHCLESGGTGLQGLAVDRASRLAE